MGSVCLVASIGSSSVAAAEFVRTLNLAPAQLASRTVPDALFGANIGYWSVISAPSLVAAATEAGLTVLRYHPGTYNDPNTVPGSINMWDFTAVDDFGAARLGDFGRFLIATGATGQIHFNYGAGSPAQAAALVAYLRVRTDAPEPLLNRSLGSAVVEPTLTGTRTRDWRTVGFWANLRASAPLPVDDGFNKLRLNHPEPFPVKYWECGNEADYSPVPCFRHKVPGENSITQGATGFGGRRADAHTYANFYAAAKALMQEVDPAIQVGASAGYFEQTGNDTDSPAVPFLFPGGSGTTRAWTPVMLTRLRELGVVPDFIIAHRYTQQTDFAWNNNYLLRGSLRAYLASPAQGGLPGIHVTEINWAENESVPYTTTINNAVNLARSFGDALQNDVTNLCWFTFTSGSANYAPASTSGWRRYHNWGLLADTPSPASLAWPGHFAGARFPVFHAFSLLKTFVRPGDQIYQAAALAPENINSHAVTVFAARRANGDLTLLVLNKDDATHALKLTLSDPALSSLSTTATGLRYGKAQDEEQRLKALATPPILTNNTPESFTVSRTGSLLDYTVPPLSVTVLTFAPDLTPPPAPSFSALPATTTALQGQPFALDIVATPGTVTYSATGLPAGLTLQPTTGRLSGNPAAIGEFPVNLTATNITGTTSATWSLLVTPVSTQTLTTETFNAGHTAGWWAFSGDSGVSHTLTNAPNGPSASPALNLAVNVTAPPATYWFAGVGKSFATTPPFSPGTLATTVIGLDVWVSAPGGASVNLVFKTSNNGTLSHARTLTGNTWTSLSVPLTSFTNAQFDFAAASWEFMVLSQAGWPLATASLRIDNLALARLTPAYSALQNWRDTHFSTHAPVGQAADRADPDADGLPNLLEYAFGSTPTSAASAALPTFAVGTGPDTGKLQLTFLRTRPDLTYTVQGSSDLATWTNLTINPGAVSLSTPVTFTDTVDLSTATPSRRFLRVRVTTP